MGILSLFGELASAMSRAMNGGQIAPVAVGDLLRRIQSLHDALNDLERHLQYLVEE